jgi:D-alanyl-D-alanine carboxypeptidase (penicillin-binding protein 5/6)
MQQMLKKALLPMLAVGAIATAVPAVAADRATLLTWAGAPVEVSVVTDDVRTGTAGEDVGDLTFTSGPKTVTIDLELQSDLDDPGPWWRLTHPAELF